MVVLLGPLWLTALGLAASRLGWKGLALAMVAGLAAFALVLRGEVGDPNRLYVLQHAGINALLGGWFGASLRGERLSLIGQFAQRVHPLSPAQRIYTAQVTKVWTFYFVLMVLASITIYLALPFAAWSLFANVLTPLFVTALFLGEHLMRYRLHPEFERTRLVDAVRAFHAPAPDRGVER